MAISAIKSIPAEITVSTGSSFEQKQRGRRCCQLVCVFVLLLSIGFGIWWGIHWRETHQGLSRTNNNNSTYSGDDTNATTNNNTGSYNITDSNETLSKTSFAITSNNATRLLQQRHFGIRKRKQN